MKKIQRILMYCVIFMVFPCIVTCGIPVGGTATATRPIRDSQVTKPNTVGFYHVIDTAYDVNRYYFAYQIEVADEDNTPTASNKSSGLSVLDYSSSPKINTNSSQISELFLLGTEGSYDRLGLIDVKKPALTFNDPSDFGANTEIRGEVTATNRTSTGEVVLTIAFDTPVSFDGGLVGSNPTQLGRVVYPIDEDKATRETTEVITFEDSYNELVTRSNYADIKNLPLTKRSDESVYVHLYVMYEVREVDYRDFNSGGFIYFGTLKLDIIN